MRAEKIDAIQTAIRRAERAQAAAADVASSPIAREQWQIVLQRQALQGTLNCANAQRRAARGDAYQPKGLSADRTTALDASATVSTEYANSEGNGASDFKW